MANYRALGSLVLVASFLLEVQCSPDPSAKLLKQKTLLQKGTQQVDLVDSLSTEDKVMFAEIWVQFTQGDFMSLEQLNSLFRATDHELGELQFSDTDWQKLCKEKGADPNKGLSRQDLLSMYFDANTHPESTLKKDYIRVFEEGGTPPPPVRKNLLQKNSDKAALLDTEDARMFNEIWMKYSGREFMSLEQLNMLLRDTDHELGKQEVTDSWWQSLCKEQGADSNKGLSKQNLLNVYLTKNIGSSIKNDYIRIFVEGATPAADLGQNVETLLTV